MNFSNFTKNKRIGYWFSVAITLLFLITGIVYLVSVKGNAVLSEYRVLNSVATASLFTGFGLSLILLALQEFKLIPAKLNIVPYIQGICALLALCFFVYGAYYYVSVVMVGIDLDAYEGVFFVNVILFAITLVVSVANVFLKQIDEDEEVSHE